MSHSRAPRYLHIKLAGGATAQCLGLMNALYASSKLGTPFKISYYPYSTGTFWPFEIGFLLRPEEILGVNLPTKGLDLKSEFRTGQIIKSHPLFRSNFSYEKFLSFLRRTKIESIAQILRRELVVKAEPQRIINIKKYFNTISGGFAPINEPTVNKLMHDRFKMAQCKSPFENKKYENHITIIHYRLGDKKATPLQMQFTKDFNTDLIIHPNSYSSVLSTIKKLDLENIYVVSDEPKLAQNLLLQVGVKAKIRPNTGNIWADLEFMSSASNFIGTKSQVSQLANIFVEHNGGKSYMLNFKKHRNYNQFKNTTYLEANFIEPTNRIYKMD